MYPLCCIDIRNFLNQIYLFSDDNFDRSSIIDDNLKNVRPTDLHYRASEHYKKTSLGLQGRQRQACSLWFCTLTDTMHLQEHC